MLLIMAQVDDVPGELMGEFIRRAEDLGARNIQAVSSITKKGRPGYIVYVDVPASLESEIANLLGGELGTWGYRIIAAEHKHFQIERFTVPLTVSIENSVHHFDLRAKTISQADAFTRIKAEHDDLSAISASLRDKGFNVSLTALKAETESQLRKAGAATDIKVIFNVR